MEDEVEEEDVFLEASDGHCYYRLLYVIGTYMICNCHACIVAFATVSLYARM